MRGKNTKITREWKTAASVEGGERVPLHSLRHFGPGLMDKLFLVAFSQCRIIGPFSATYHSGLPTGRYFTRQMSVSIFVNFC